jgi:S-sulfo-L-cysteine synthase (3-phospho-L-serine-dependent)
VTGNRQKGPVLALVESNTTGTGRMFAAAARERGLRPVLLSSRPERYPWVVEDGVDVAWADTNDAAAVAAGARAVAEGGGLAGLVTSSEYFVAVTARATTRLGLPGPDPGAVERCRDKRLQRAALAGSGVPVPAFAASVTSEEAVEAATAVGLPVVVKPVDGTGSRGVRLCDTGDEVRRHTAALLADRRDERGQPTLPAVLVEEYVEGPELSVETFGTEVVGITAKYLGPPPWFVEIGHDYPVAAEDVGAVALAALDALGLGFGPAHTEIRLGARGPVVIEVNPRLAGGRIPTLVRLASGIDLVGATVDAVSGSTRPLPRPGPGHASIRFLVPSRGGRVRRTGGVAAAAAVPGVVDVGIAARPGQRVGGTGSFLDRVGHVIAAGPTATAARTAAETALALLELDVDALVGGAVPAVG